SFRRPPPTETYPLSLHDALPILRVRRAARAWYVRSPVTSARSTRREPPIAAAQRSASTTKNDRVKSPRFCVSTMYASATTSETADRKSTRLNSSHLGISYAVFCL